MCVSKSFDRSYEGRVIGVAGLAPADERRSCGDRRDRNCRHVIAGYASVQELGILKQVINASGHQAALGLPSVTRLDSKFPD